MAINQQKTIILLVAVLLAVIASSVAVLLLLSAGEREVQLQESDSTATTQSPVGQTERFNTKVFDRSSFRNLDQTLINDRALPVEPPAAVGKANPFL